jgi:putative membrane protein
MTKMFNCTKLKTGITRGSIAFVALLTSIALQTQAQQTPGNTGNDRPGQQKPKSDYSAPGQGESKSGQQGEAKSGQFHRGDLGAYSDAKFIEETAQHNDAEIKLGQLAAKKSDNGQLKQFANQLVDDHTKLGEKLRTCAAKQNVTLPLQMDAKHQEKLDKLQAASGTEFDQEFAKCMIKGHAKNVAKFQQASQQSSNSELRKFAEETLPKLREHLRKAQDVGKAVGLDSATIASLMQEFPAAGSPGIGVEVETGKDNTDIDKKQGERPDSSLNRDDLDSTTKGDEIPKKK